jgi:hypothetical protein
MHAFARSVVQLPGGLWEQEEAIERQRLVRIGESPDPSKAYLGVPLSQYDLAMTLLGFSSVAMSYIINDFGVQMSTQERDDLTHFWRYIGYHIGIREEFNSCSTTTEAEQMAREMFSYSLIFAKGARSSTPLLSHSLMKGFGRYTGVPNSVLVVLPVIVGENRSWNLDVLRPLTDISVESAEKALPVTKKPGTIPHNHSVKFLVRLLHRLMPSFPWIRLLMNGVIRNALHLMCYYPSVSTWVEANFLPCVSMPTDFMLRLLEAIVNLINRSKLLTQVLVPI